MIDVGWVVPLIAGAIFLALSVVAVWGGYRYFLKCREVGRLRQEIDGWQGAQTSEWYAPFGWPGSEWDTMCDEMRDTTTTGSTSDDDE